MSRESAAIREMAEEEKVTRTPLTTHSIFSNDYPHEKATRTPLTPQERERVKARLIEAQIRRESPEVDNEA